MHRGEAHQRLPHLNEARFRRRGWMMFALIVLGIGSIWTFGQPLVRPLAAQEATDSAPADSGEEADDSNSGKQTALTILLAAGWIGLLILLLSLAVVYFIIEHAISIRKSKLIPEEVLVDLEQMIAHNQIDEAIEYCTSPDSHSLAADVIQSGLERFKGSEFGFAEYKTAVEEAGEDHTGRLYRKTEVLNVIGAIAPMLGLTGTVLGMITAFMKIAETKGAAKPEELADGIGQALVTTLLGLFVAIPAMVAVSFFRNKIDSLVAEAGKRIERVMAPLGRKR